MNNKEEILMKVNTLVHAYRQGILGGEKMPEDENPHLDKGSKEKYMYFTLPIMEKDMSIATEPFFWSQNHIRRE